MNVLARIMIWTGGTALIAAAGLNLLSVIGRHTGLPLKGAIELVQVGVLVAGTLALVSATLARNHARVHLVLDRLKPGGAHLVERLSLLLTMAFYAVLLCGSAWLASDLWGSQEVSELLGVPWRWLRMFLNAGLVVVLVLLARQLVERKR
ncbi:TRAP transporter small permease [Novosphingobium sp. EMRT-2]|uniref:TRAP transporter small permease n=1 Tax=Novosphingobium sp. EMRT-2 TaxID=2571749 RepID=UPI0010BD2788|nr:TRAP transporter small permease subunit [Novosphingobium sp. EMRT-2]QCI95922.1 TRAP transporter small permease subunit [Novosphingobium sp. EMRT-2]